MYSAITARTTDVFAYEKYLLIKKLHAFKNETFFQHFFLQDMFHVYLNKCEFQFLRLHINETSTFCFLIDNGRVTGRTK